MRRLKLVVRSVAGKVPVIIAASLGSGACADAEGSGTNNASATAGTSGGGAGGSGGGAGQGGLNTGGVPTIPDAGSDASACLPHEQHFSFDVELPAEGTPADPGQICMATAEPVESGRAARVVLRNWDAVDSTAEGFVEVDARVMGQIIGEPVVELVGTSDPRLDTMSIGAMTPEPEGFRFSVSWPESVVSYPLGTLRLSLRITLNLECAGADGGSLPKVVHAATDLYLCDDGDSASTWVSSGDRCIVCDVIAEMAPSPIVPDTGGDDLGLARALRLRVVELARVNNRVVLLAENDGGEGLEYEWHVSGGEIERLAPDVIVWTLEDGMAAPFLQAAVTGPDVAAVTSYSFNDEAA